jgi:hypothetical protein
VRSALPALLGALVFALPAPPAEADTLTVGWCGGAAGASITIPMDGPPPGDHGCCTDRACHAACERKQIKRRGGGEG